MWFNPLITAILRSPLHGLLSRSTLLIGVRGRRSGRVYTTPVNYVAVADEMWTVSWRKRTWWRNLRGGAAVSLLLRGKTVEATATAVEEEAGVVEGLSRLLEAAPGYGRYLGVSRQPDGRPELEPLRAAARTRVLIRIRAG